MKKIENTEDWNSIDELIENQVRQINHIPSTTDFTAKVLNKISIAKQSQARDYQPIISKKGWFMLVVLVSTLVIYSFNLNPTENIGWFTTESNYFLTITIPEISFFHNKTIVNSIATGCVMLLLQFFIISKKYQIKD